MNTSVKHYLSKLTFGEPKTFENITVVPLFNSQNGELDFYTLNEAKKQKDFSIKEVSGSGTVPLLTVVNYLDKPVILIEGEEIVGLKQNRILNTTVVIKEKTTTEIPVSCCEVGRWSYHQPRRISWEDDSTDVILPPRLSRSQDIEDTSDRSKDDLREHIESNFIAPSELRAKKVLSVNDALKMNFSYHSNQGMVWNEIDKIHRKVGIKSRTGAIQDSFKKAKKSLDEYEKAFPLSEEQKGILVIINGKVAGCDFFCSHKLFSKLYDKLIKSYTFDAWVNKNDKEFNIEPLQVAEDFLNKMQNSKEVKQIDLGDTKDYRYESEEIVGFALVYDDKVVHSAFFPNYNRQRYDYHINSRRF